MISQSDVRLVAAAVAAIGLHALVFMVLPSSHVLEWQKQGGALQVELLKRQPAIATRVSHSSQEQQADSVQPHRVVADKQQQVVIASPRRIQAEAADKISPARLQTDSIPAVPVSAAAPAAQSQVTAYLPSERRASAANAARDFGQPGSGDVQRQPAVMPVPSGVQARILAQVHYPRQARRHGWQGRAEFQLDVQQQSIQTITLLASTGYPILDRAAHRGLISASHVALSNGLYRMPVVFRLQ